MVLTLLHRLRPILFGIAALLFASGATTTTVSPSPVLHFTDNNGNSCAGCLLFTYAAGTTTPLNTYTDSTGGTPNANPVVLNTRGEANVWLTPGLGYKFVLSPSTDTNPPTNPFYTVDNLSNLSISYTPLVAGAACNGSSDDSGAFTSANAIGPFSVPVSTAGCVINANITLTAAAIFPPNAFVRPGNGFTITFTGPVSAGAYKICDTSLGGHCDFTNASTTAQVEWWNVVGGDTAYNATNAAANGPLIQEAVNYAPPILNFHKPGLYSTTCLTLTGTRGLIIDGLGQSGATTGETEGATGRNGIVGNGCAWPDAANMKSTVAPTGNTHSNTTIDGLSSMNDVQIGDTISGAGIPTGDTISAINWPANSATLLTAASATASGVTLTITKNDPSMFLTYVVMNGAESNGNSVILHNLQVFCVSDQTCAAIGVLQSTAINTQPSIFIEGGSYWGYFGAHFSKLYNNYFSNAVFVGNGGYVNPNFWSGAGGAGVAMTAPHILEPDGIAPTIARTEFYHDTLQMIGNSSGQGLFEDQSDYAGGALINDVSWTQLNVVGPMWNGLYLKALGQTFSTYEGEQYANVPVHEVGQGASDGTDGAYHSTWINPYWSSSTSAFCNGLSQGSIIIFRNQLIAGESSNCAITIALGKDGVTMPTRARASAHYTMSPGSVTGDGTAVTLVPDTVDYNVGGWYNSGTGAFTCPPLPVQGSEVFVRVTANVTATTASDSTALQVAIRDETASIEAVARQSFAASASTTPITVPFAYTINCTPGDTLLVQGSVFGSGSKDASFAVSGADILTSITFEQEP